MDRTVLEWMENIEAAHCDNSAETKQERAHVVDASIRALRPIEARTISRTVPAPEYGHGVYWIPQTGAWALRVQVPTVRGSSGPPPCHVQGGTRARIVF